MLISVVIPSYNQGRYIRETIDSILSQDYRPIEILVIDGNSNDETISILKSYNNQPELMWVSEPDNGVTEAINKGLALAKGDIVAIQSSDDLYLAHAFVKIISIFDKDKDLDLIFAEAEYIDQNSEVKGRSHIGQYSLANFLSRKCYIVQSSAFFRRKKWEQLGGWRSEFSYVADNEFWLRICMSGKAMSIADVLSQYRYHSEQRDTQKQKIAHDWAEMVRLSPEIKDLSLLKRMAAKGGVYFTQAHNTEETNWMSKSWFSYLAMVCYPPLYSVLDKRDLMIGYRPIRKFFSILKRIVKRNKKQ